MREEIHTDLENMILIDRFLEDKMSLTERKNFKKRLKKDRELQEDYELFTSELERFHPSPLHYSEDEAINIYEIDLKEKKRFGRNFIYFGLGAALILTSSIITVIAMKLLF